MNRAFRIKQQDDMQQISMLAWQNKQAGATKKNGKPVFKSFSEFYDSEKRFLQAVKGKTPQEKRTASMSDMNMILNN